MPFRNGNLSGPSKEMATKPSKTTKSYISKVAHDNDVRITKQAKSLYAQLPDKAAVDDMISHASQLVKSMKKKVITEQLAKVEMRHYSKGKEH
jgi:hypothetical protein